MQVNSLKNNSNCWQNMSDLNTLKFFKQHNLFNIETIFTVVALHGQVAGEAISRFI